MPGDIPSFDSLAEFYATMGFEIEKGLEISIQDFRTLHSEVPVVSPLFRANYYTVVIIQEGKGLYKLDDKEYEIRDGTVYFTNPGHIKGFEIHQRTKGHLISFSDAFLKQHCPGDRYQDLAFILAERPPPWYAPEQSVNELARLSLLMLNEFTSDSPVKQPFLGSMLVSLLLKMKAWCWLDYDPLKEGRQGSGIVEQFKQNLNQAFSDLLSGKTDQPLRVQTLAAKQFLNPGYFSTVIKNKTGKTVNQWIIEKTITEAKALLKSSQAPVQNVAYQLAFSEPTQFSKFFKKYTGLTPTAFRRLP